MIVISGGTTGINFLQGNPIDLIAMVYTAMKADEKFEAIFRLAQEFDIFKNGKEEPEKEPDCENCDAREICPIAGGGVDSIPDELLKEMLIKTKKGKEYKA